MFHTVHPGLRAGRRGEFPTHEELTMHEGDSLLRHGHRLYQPRGDAWVTEAEALQRRGRPLKTQRRKTRDA